MTSSAGCGPHRFRACCSAASGGVRFYPVELPAMSGLESVRYLHRFRLGDTYQLKTRGWLLPQFLSGALTLCGVILTLVGVICLQINKYLHVCDSDEGVNCNSNKANINNVMMPIGVGLTGGGLSLILISGFIFVHAFCVIYDDAEHQDEAQQLATLHVPAPQARDDLADSMADLSRPPRSQPHRSSPPQPPPQPPPPPPPPPPSTPSPAQSEKPPSPSIEEPETEKTRKQPDAGDATQDPGDPMLRSQSFYDNLTESS